MDTLEKIVKENDSSNSNGLLTKIRKTIAPYVGAAMIGLSGLVYSGCGSGPEPCTQGCGDSDGGDSDVLNHPPATINDATVVPPDNSTYNVGDDITVGFDAPTDEDGDTLTGTVNVTGPDSETFSLGTLTPGQHYSQVVETAGMTPGDYTIEIVVSDGKDGESTATRDVTLNALPEKPYVEGCNVNGSSVGGSLSIMCTGASPSGPITGWNLTGGPSGAIITGSGNVATGRTMEVSDVGLHTYNVTCTDGTATSDVYTFTVPVDEHDSYLNLHCQGANTEMLKLPETSVDAVATTCGTGFNETLKPDTSADPHYVLDVTQSCVQGAINALPADEQAAHEHYNGGQTVDDVYSSCTVDFAQVEYIHN